MRPQPGQGQQANPRARELGGEARGPLRAHHAHPEGVSDHVFRPLLCTHNQSHTGMSPGLGIGDPLCSPCPAQALPAVTHGHRDPALWDPDPHEQAAPTQYSPRTGCSAGPSCTARPVTLARWSVSCLLQDMLWTLMM